MPGGDRTGPTGLGSMTGRGAGFCAGNQVPGYANPVAGGEMRYGFGGGRGRGGWGRRNMFHATGVPGWQRSNAGYPAYGGTVPNSGPYGPTPTRKQELDMLKAQAEYLENALGEIKERIIELDAESESK